MHTHTRHVRAGVIIAFYHRPHFLLFISLFCVWTCVFATVGQKQENTRTLCVCVYSQQPWMPTKSILSCAICGIFRLGALICAGEKKRHVYPSNSTIFHTCRALFFSPCGACEKSAGFIRISCVCPVTHAYLLFWKIGEDLQTADTHIRAHCVDVNEGLSVNGPLSQEGNQTEREREKRRWPKGE